MLAQVRNVTSVIRNLRLLPPASQYFHMSMLSFPMDNGCIAPGMAAEVTLRFTPDSLADYDDELAVDTAGHRFSVQIQVRSCLCVCETVLWFTPHFLADYDDELEVDTAGHRFSVQIQVRSCLCV
jgi:hypothetical protein